MPSPFPGMDPFVENGEIFPDLHFAFISHLRDTIQPMLPKNYYAAAATRAWLELSQRPIIPDTDLRLIAPAKPKARPGKNGKRKAGGVLIITPPKPKLIRVPFEERREPYMNIYSKKHGGDQLVACIEVLSPTNKIYGSDVREKYQDKQLELLDSEVHLIEIDLLRGGEHTTAIPLAYLVKAAWPFDYHVCVRDYAKDEQFQIYAFQLPQIMPTISVPLRPRDGKIIVDLQRVFRKAYDAAAFSRRIEYNAILSLSPPLQPEQLEWAAKLLRQKGLLSQED